MGGKVIFGVLSCEMETRGRIGKDRDRFVRININDGVAALPGCDKGPGMSCRLGASAVRVARERVALPGFRELCGLGKDAAETISFLHQ
jgi:acid phosphatase